MRGSEEMWSNVMIYNVEEDEEEGWFPGPRENIAIGKYLYSFDKTSMIPWELQSGIGHKSIVCKPISFQRAHNAFLCHKGDMDFEILLL